MTRKFWGLPIGITDPKTLIREMKLGVGHNPSSEAKPVRYHMDEAAARVYRAEQKLRKHYAAMDPTPELWFADLAAVQRYVDTVLSWPWPHWKPWACRVQTTAAPVPDYRSGIYLPSVPAALRELVVLHELAHHFGRQRPENMDHGLLFQTAFQDLLADAMGLQARETFREFLRAEGVVV